MLRVYSGLRNLCCRPQGRRGFSLRGTLLSLRHALVWGTGRGPVVATASERFANSDVAVRTAPSLSQKDQEVDDVTSRRRSKALISLFAMASVGALVASNAVSATTVPPGTEPAGTEAPAGSAPAGGGGVGEVGGSGCGTPHGPYEDPGDPVGEVRVAWNDPLLSFNNNTIHATRRRPTSTRCYLMNVGGFSYFDADLKLINNDQFGTCTVESLDPLTITYRINEGVTWTDGVQVDAADMLLYWASHEHACTTTRTPSTPPEGVSRRRRRERLADRRRPRRSRDHLGRRGGVRRRLRPRDRCTARGLHLQGDRRHRVRRRRPVLSSWPPSCR